MNVDGDFVVTWHSYGQDGSGDGIFARRYNAAGLPQSGEIPINTTTTGAQIFSSVAMDANGDFVVAWQSSLQDGSGEGIYARRYNAAGVSQSGEIPVNTTTLNNQETASVAMDADGDFVVTWQSPDQNGSGVGIFARQYNAAGVPQSGEFRVNSITLNEQQNATVAMDGDGDFVVTWTSNLQDGSSYGIYAQRFNESTTTAGALVTEIRDLDRQITPGGRLNSTLDTLTVVFTENLSIVGGAGGVNSVLTPANWRLTQDGVDVSSMITEVSFLQSVETGKYEAELILGSLLASATYRLTILDTIHGLTGNALDGDFNGTPGGSYHHSFAIAAVQTSGPEFRVNSTTVNNQENPSVATDADGDFVVAWQSLGQDGSNFGIFAQRYNSAGVPMGGEIPVNTTTVNNQQNPSVAMDADGDFVVTWQSYLQDGSSFGIYAQRYNAAGVPQGSEFPVNTTTANSQARPVVAMDADGDFVVTWQSNLQDGGFYGIYARKYNAAGVPQSGEIPVNTSTASNDLDPTVAMDADGDFVVTWSSGRTGIDFGIFAQRFNAAGVREGFEFGVNTTSANIQSDSDVAMDLDGDFVVTWQSDIQDGSSSGIYAQRYNAAGVRQGGEFRVNTNTADNQLSPAVSMDADGDYVVTWQSYLQDGSGNGIYAQRYNSAGVPQGSEFRVNTTTANGQSFSSVSMDADGDFIVAWTSNLQDGSSDGIYAQRYQSDAPVQLTSGLLTISGSNTDDVMNIERVSTAGSPDSINVFRNGIHYSIDIANVTGIVMNGATGHDRLTIDATLSAPATINGDGGNDTLIGAGGSDILNGGKGNDLYVFDTDTALGFDIVSDTQGIDTLDFSATEFSAVTVELNISFLQVVNPNHSLRLAIDNSIENVLGGAMNDTLIGNLLSNSLTGGSGDDTMTGGAGNDRYLFDVDQVQGADTINEAGGGIDTLDFSATTTRGIS
ncbi:MAG: hypothetical protein ACK50J_30695, partial [Planctomyces sp.]